MHKKIILLSILSLFFMVGCQTNTLQKKTTKFSANGSDYSIQLPSHWQKDKKETAINKSAVVSSKDTKSNSGMYILTEKMGKLSEKELEKHAKGYLEDYYVLKGVKANRFVANGHSVINYTISAKYEEKNSLLDVYYVATENSVISLFFFSPIDNDRAYDKRKQNFDRSVESLNEKVTNEVTEESSNELDNRIQNKNFSLQVSTYEVKQVEDEKLLVIRYLTTNKDQEVLKPIDQWKRYMKVYQGEKELTRQENKELSDNTLDYLSQNSFKNIEKEEAVEAAVIYSLDKNNEEDVTIQFDDTEFKNKEPLTLTLN
ncbi:DUF5067 domain-containing protein [Enterococcus sp. DIV0242_7C1]|uniref:DUF5067 domain-containing protein n=1 Tax=Candidatus Enterococcus dunnyi TaxID=1834192 RepID=A0A200J052_9ENTE|nr:MULTISPECIES: DUF5067 domain-containing protein [unclassified Enterococcus]MBO0470115.1 DUF5067 domain-containing protein [Enterococcus sp. DIV0242_7C1]OUZ30568.1 hypothetical protein A5889_002856 [Enterococcus sp. 9D6_DIV0238]